MRPPLTIQNHGDSSGANLEFARHFTDPMIFPAFQNLKNNMFRKFRQAVLFASIIWRSMSAFLDSVNHIVCGCSKEKMVRIYAWRIVAFVKHQTVIWNITKMNLPRGMTSPKAFSYLTPTSSWNSNNPVSFFAIISSSPNPARRKAISHYRTIFFNKSPKPDAPIRSLFRSFLVTLLAAIFPTCMRTRSEHALAR